MRITFAAFAAFCLGMLLAPLAIAQNSFAGAASGSEASAGAAAGATSGAAAGAVLIQNQAPIPSETTSHQDLHYSGEYRLKNTPNVINSNIYPTSPCSGSSSGGVGVPGFGISVGSSWKDEDCDKREVARMFYTMGMKDDAVAVLCASTGAAAAPVCQKAMQQPAAKASADPVRDGDDSRRTSYGSGETVSKAKRWPNSSENVNLPTSHSEYFNTEIVAAANGTLWKKRDGQWYQVSVVTGEIMK